MARRLGFGCLRLVDRGPIDAARAAGIGLFDTARAYGNEALLEGLEDVEIVSKVGLRREGASWIPDGRARAILEDAAETARALGRAPDVLLLHAPDARVPLATSVRALAECVERGLAKAVGLSNVTLRQLDEAQAITPIAAVQVALGAYDDVAAREGLVGACGARGIPVLGYAPLGGPRRASRTLGDRVLRAQATRLDASTVAVLLAYLMALHPTIVPLFGSAQPAHVAEAARAVDLELDEEALAALDARYRGLGRLRAPRHTAPSGAEVILLMGLAGAGKSRLAERMGGARLNRDTLGGTLKKVNRALAELLAAGERRVVLDNTYLTRAARAETVAVAREHGATVRCVHLATPLADAQVNVVLRMLERRGALLDPAALAIANKTDPNLLGPTTLFRMARDLEAPSLDEGFTSIEEVPFVREGSFGDGAATCVALDRALADPGALAGEGPVLAFGWREAFVDDGSLAARLTEYAGRPVEVGVCPHPSGPPRCWCRPPLPGLLVAFFLRHGVDPRRVRVLGDSPAHGLLARALGAHLVT